jgi:hypothetical protein
MDTVTYDARCGEAWCTVCGERFGTAEYEDAKRHSENCPERCD